MPTINIPDLTERNKIGVDVNYPLNGDYLQTADIDGTAGVLVIGTGTGALRFAGVYNANNFKTINVTINNPTLDYQGLFGSTVGATIMGIADVTGTITGKDYVGMIGRAYSSAISLCKCSAVMSGASFVGGLVGNNVTTVAISNCHTVGAATAATNFAGGIVGYNATSSVTSCFSVGAIVATSYAGGLVGYNSASSSISYCYATGNATVTSNYAGGLVGLNTTSAIYTASIATGNYSGTYSTRLCGRDLSTEISTGAHLTVAQAQMPIHYLAWAWNFVATWVMPIVMPTITGKTISEAQNLLSAQGCTLSITSSVYHATVPAGQIITQSIAAGGTAGYPQLQAHGMPDSPRTGDVVAVTVSLGNQVEVQNTLGLTQAAAEALLAADAFTVTVVEATSETVAAGLVMAQDPAGGTLATYQSVVTITVSTGHADVSVPNVIGDILATAIDEIEASNLTADITEASSEVLARGYVISQLPVALASVAYGSSVAITVSTGTALISVPGILGLTQAAAESLITNEGFVPSATTAYSDWVLSGIVFEQSPVVDTFASVGSTVSFTVSEGIEPVAVPNVVGLSQVDAESNVSLALLTSETTFSNNNIVTSGLVISQNPDPDTIVDKGSIVEIVVSLGNETVEVPNTVGMSENDAISYLEGLGFTTASSYATDPIVIQDAVISQSPVYGTSVLYGTLVTITVSTGHETCVVPNVVGITEASAISGIEAEDLVAEINYDYSFTVDEGYVISQLPVSGETVNTGTTVVLQVSLGVGQTQVPHLTYMDQETAEAELVETGLTSSVTTSFSSSIPIDLVISTVPVYNTTVDLGSNVEIIMSLGTSTDVVPNVVGQLQATAESMIGIARLVPSVTLQYSPTVAAGYVISQSPIPNLTVAVGSTVQIVVSRGIQYVEIPNLIDMTKEDAIALLESLGIVVEIEYRAV